jgi:hypothetical protein
VDVVLGGGDRPAPARLRAAAPPGLPQLPGGGRRLLPDRRIVAFYGAPQERPGLSMVLNADGFGGQAIKKAKYGAFTHSPRAFLHRGFKLFYREDTDLMRPREVLRLRPPPDVVIYE